MWARVPILALMLAAAPAQADAMELEVARAEAKLDRQSAEPIIVMMLTRKSAASFADFTRANIGRPIRVSFEGKVIAAPIIKEPIPGQWLQISGKFTVAEANRLAAAIHSAMSIDVELVSQP